MLRAIAKYTLNEIYKFRFRNRNVRFLSGVSINKCDFEGHNSVAHNSVLMNCHIGTGSYIGENVRFSHLKIGRFCSLGSRIYNTSGRHPTTKFVSTHPSFFSSKRQAGFTFRSESIFPEHGLTTDGYYAEIGNDVWIGDDVTILDGLTIGNGAIIGAGSLVTKNIEPYAIYAGVPAKKIRSRFNDNDIQFLIDSAWWDKPFEWIKENAESFDEIEKFRDLISKSHSAKNSKSQLF
ncbi:CatB-related O-acetyltransferase [Dyadobacter sp. Leaf189]|uniref:CatB-related O-acetyltransferase n=1 Tax=Dyadobacter sp. Leaf189 TaxID=1736295 RepID=UPI0006F39711|nr:CatB-related O-acetyltransferase [Dyadobacter sp. Leaf189]KQS30696.1 hypothetical protein ASG33_09905 [Dyadobacter sp. Leaf189]